jgi:DNA-binding MarR family transcriptional regulator
MKYIAETLGIKTFADNAPWAGAKRLQYFLTDAYDFTPVTLGEAKCLFVKPKGELAAISAVKKHLGIIAEQAGVPLVLDTPALDAKQRKALIAARIPFVVDGNQLYLPFIGAALQERYINPEKRVDTLSPTAQLVLFRYLYQNEREMYISGHAELFGVSAMQITRAVKQLAALGLIATRKDGVQIVIAGTDGGSVLFEKSKPYLLNPVRRRFYVDNDALPPNLPFAGETALGEYTMLAPPRIAVRAYDGKVGDLQGTDTLVDWDAQTRVEVWRYSPTVLSRKDGVADPLSLWAAIANETGDPRLEMAKEEVLAGQFNVLNAGRAWRAE